MPKVKGAASSIHRKEMSRDTRRRFEQWASNPSCEANTVSAVHNIQMAKVAERIGVKPSFGASPFALARGNEFEANLLKADGAFRHSNQRTNYRPTNFRPHANRGDA